MWQDDLLCIEHAPNLPEHCGRSRNRTGSWINGLFTKHQTAAGLLQEFMRDAPCRLKHFKPKQNDSTSAKLKELTACALLVNVDYVTGGSTTCGNGKFAASVKEELASAPRSVLSNLSKVPASTLCLVASPGHPHAMWAVPPRRWRQLRAPSCMRASTSSRWSWRR